MFSLWGTYFSKKSNNLSCHIPEHPMFNISSSNPRYRLPWSPALINLASTWHVKNITLIFHVQEEKLSLINPVVRHWSYTYNFSQWQNSPVEYGVEFPVKTHTSIQHFLLYIRCNYSLQSGLTLWDPMDCSPPGSSVCGTLQARILDWF